MTQENINLFLERNKNTFNEEDLTLVKSALENVDDSFTYSLLGKSFTPVWLNLVIVGLYLAGGYFISAGLFALSAGMFYMNRLFWVAICVMAAATFGAALYLQKKVKKDANLKTFLTFVSAISHLK